MSGFARLVRGRGTLAALLAGLLALAGPAAAQVTPQPNGAGGTPTLSTPQAGKAPVVDITGPNASGVSHNVYGDFNVGAEGMVFNNSTSGGENSVLLGTRLWANQNLNGTSAKVILNEVTGGNISKLLGYMEVYGAAADFIVANPNGVTCRGCGFINTPRATLTTGAPVWGANGALLGFDVNGSGQIRIDQGTGSPAFGADVTGVQYFDIIARSIVIAGKINGGANTEIGMFAGRNNYDYNTRTVTAKADDGSAKPEFGIDSTALGGAYANRITLIATEKGVGVRSPAEMTAAYGGIGLTADGKIIFGKTQSKGGIKANSTSGDIELAQNVWSETALDLTAGKKIAVLDKVTAGAKGDVKLASSSLDLASGAYLGAGLDADGKLTGAGTLTATAAALNNAGTIAANEDVTLDVSGAADNSGQILAGQTLALIGGSVFHNTATGALSGKLALNLVVTEAFNAGSIYSDAAVTVAASKDIANSGGMKGQSVSLTAGGAIANQAGGTVSSSGGTSLTAGSLSNAGTLSSGGSVTASVTGNLTNSQTISGQSVSLTAGTLANQGSIASAGGANLKAGSLSNTGTVSAAGLLVADIAGDLTNSGRMTAGGDGRLKAGGILTNELGAELKAGATLTIEASTLTNIGAIDETVTDGLITARDLVIKAGDVQNAGGLTADHDVTITASASVKNVLGRIEAGNVLRITAGKMFANLSGRVHAGQDVFIDAPEVENTTLVKRDKELIIPAAYQGLFRAAVQQKVDQAVKDYQTARAGQIKQVEEKIWDAIRKQFGEAALTDGLKQKIGALLEQYGGTGLDSTAQMPEKLAGAIGAALNASGNSGGLTKLGWFGFAVQRTQTSPLQDGIAAVFSGGQNAGAAETAILALLADSFKGNAKLGEAEKAISGILRTDLAATGAAEAAQAKILQAVQNGGTSSFLQGTFTSLAAASGNYTDTVAGVAEISAGRNLTLNAATGFSDTGGKLAAGGDIALTAGKVDMMAQALSMVNNKGIKGGRDNLSTVTHQMTDLDAGGRIVIAAAGDMKLAGVSITSGGDTALTAGGALDTGGVKDEYHHDYYRKKSGFLGFSSSTNVDKKDSSTTVQTVIKAGGKASITGEKDVTITGTKVEAEGDIDVASTSGNVVLKGDRDITIATKYSKSSSWWGLVGSGSGSSDTSDVNMPTFVSAKGDVNLLSHAGDLSVIGSSVEAGGDIRVDAQTVQILAAQNIIVHSEWTEKRGLFAEGFAGDGKAGVSFGWRSEKNTSTDTENLAQVSSLIAYGSITIEAETDFTSQGAVLAAAGDLIVNAGQDINMLAAYDTVSHRETHDKKQIGVTVSAGENVSSALKTLANAPKDFNSGQGGGIYSTVTQASTVMRSVDAVSGLVYGPLVSVNASIGVSSSSSKSGYGGTYAHAGVLQAGGDIELTAGHDLMLEGTQAKAGGQVLADAANDLVIQSALSHTWQESKTRERSASVGVSVGLGFTGLSASGSVSASFLNGDMHAEGVTNTNALVSGGTVTLKSGRDATVAGARVEGAVVVADIGGDLKIESRQDTYRMRSSQTGLSLSLGTGLGQAGWSGDAGGMAGQVWDKSAASLGNGAAGQQRTAGLGITYGRGSADKAWTETVTVIAGAKTVDLKVAGNTHLKGAVVGVEGGEVRLDTGTFTYEDLRDYDRSKNLSLNVNLSYSWMGESADGGQAGQRQAAAPANADSWHKRIPVKVEGSYEAKDKEGVTRATVGAGTVAARDEAKQRELEDGGKTGKLAAINRDLSKTQEVTREERKYVKIYASSEAVKTLQETAKKAGEYLSELLEEGRILSGDERQRKQLKESLQRLKEEGANVGDIQACISGGGGAQRTFLHDLFFTPAYAADTSVDCFIRFYGANKLTDKNGVSIPRDKILKAAEFLAGSFMQSVDNYLTTIQAIKEKYPDSYQNRNDYKVADLRLQEYLGYFALCATDDQWSKYVGNTYVSSKPLSETYGKYVKAAEAYKIGQRKIDEDFGLIPVTGSKDIAGLREKNPGLYKALTSHDFSEFNEGLLNGVAYLKGLPSVSDAEARTQVITTAAVDFGQDIPRVTAGGPAATYSSNGFINFLYIFAYENSKSTDGIPTNADLANSLMRSGSWNSAAYVSSVQNEALQSEADRKLFTSIELSEGFKAMLKETAPVQIYERFINYPLLRNVLYSNGYYTPVIDKNTGKPEIVDWGTAGQVQHYIDPRTGMDVYVRLSGNVYVSPSEWVQVAIDIGSVYFLARSSLRSSPVQIGESTAGQSILRAEQAGAIETIPLGYKRFRGALSSDVPTEDLPAGFIRVQELATGNIRYAGPNGAVYETVEAAKASAGQMTALGRNVAREDPVDAYRAVSNAEAEDIAKHGFRPNPSGRSMEDKWFSESQQGAEYFRDNFPDLDQVVHTKVPRIIYDRSYKHPNIDGTGPGFCVTCEDLHLLPKPVKGSK